VKKIESDEEIVKVAEALSSPTRLAILNVLAARNRILLADLVKELNRLSKSKFYDYASIQGHIEKLHFNDVVELTKDKNGQFLVILKKKVEIHTEDVE